MYKVNCDTVVVKKNQMKTKYSLFRLIYSGAIKESNLSKGKMRK